MTRVKRGVTTRKRHKKVLKLAKGYRNIRRTSYRRAIETVMKAGLHAYADRKKKKRTFRQLWIARLSAALSTTGLSYSKFIHGLETKNILLNRKVLSEIAIKQPEAFLKIVDTAR